MDQIKEEIVGSIETTQQNCEATEMSVVNKDQSSEFLKLVQLLADSDPFDIGYLQNLYEMRNVIHNLNENECSILYKHSFFEICNNNILENPHQILCLYIEIAKKSTLLIETICDSNVIFILRDLLYQEPDDTVLCSLFELIGILSYNNQNFVRALQEINMFSKIWEAIEAFSTSATFVNVATNSLLKIYSKKKDIFDNHYDFLKQLLNLEIDANLTLQVLHAYFAGSGTEKLKVEISDFIPLIFEAISIGQEPAKYALILVHSLVSLRFQCQEIVDEGLFDVLIAAAENGSDRITILKIVANICTWGPEFIDRMLSCGFEVAALESLQDSSYEETNAAAYVLSSVLWRGTLEQIYSVFNEEIINDLIELIDENERLSFNILDSLRRAVELEKQNGSEIIQEMISDKSVETIIEKAENSSGEESMVATRLLDALDIEKNET